MIYGKRKNGREHGTVYTRSEVVDFILSLSGLNTKEDIIGKKILDPSVGEGIFIFCLVKKILREYGNDYKQIKSTLHNITVVELDKMKCEIFKHKIIELLLEYDKNYSELAEEINIINNDYLLLDNMKYDVIIGNPPYVRYDNIPYDKIDFYKRLFTCFKYRSDLYIAFIEKSIKSLKSNGILTFVCSDRWLNNQYGKVLRKTIYNNYYFKDIIKINNFNAFEEEVIAYPAIISIKNSNREETRYYEPNSIKDLTFDNYYKKSRIIDFDEEGNLVFTLDNINYSYIEEQGFKIGIGIATGADKIYLIDGDTTNIENDVLIPIITRKDIKDDEIIWKNRFVINPYSNNENRLINLDDFPQLKEYLYLHKNELMKRHIAKKENRYWYKTIDKIIPGLIDEPKLLIPDISTKNIIIYDEGHYYPHHNFYYIIGNGIDNLLTLRAILSTSIVKRQIAEKGILMNGGALRWQAQTLRKIKIPNINNMSSNEKKKIIMTYNNNREEVEKILFEIINKDQEKTA